MTHQDFEDVSRFIEEGEFEYPVAIPLTPLPGTADFKTYKAQGRIMTEQLDFYTFMYNVIEPTEMTPREFDRAYDHLVFRMWSWSRTSAASAARRRSGRSSSGGCSSGRWCCSSAGGVVQSTAPTSGGTRTAAERRW
jgi:hypothetical protein